MNNIILTSYCDDKSNVIYYIDSKRFYEYKIYNIRYIYDKSFIETTLSIAKELMLERKIEKIPIVNNS